MKNDMDIDMDMERLMAEMTLEEKAAVLTGAGSMSTFPVERLSIHSVKLADGPHGIRTDTEKNCTLFPNLCCVAASWDKDKVYELGEALASECIEHDISLLLGPGINIKRHILCGRNFEYLSEDPVLAGELGAMYIKGLQDHGIGASLKHFALNNQETSRDKISVEIDERTLREIYLKGFEIAVKKAKPASVMCAYNKVWAVWCSENKFLLKDILRDQWGYEGFVISDWNAVHNTCRAVKGGLDLRMPRYPYMVEEIIAGIENGELEEADVETAAKRILKFLLKKRPEKKPYDRQLQHERAKEAAAEGMVLLKNDNQALPLTAEKYSKIAVIGEFAKSPLVCGQGSAEVNVNREFVDSPLQQLIQNLDDVEIRYQEFYKKAEYSSTMLWPQFKQFRSFIQDSDAVVFFIGSMESEDTEFLDRRDAYFNPNYEMFIREACKHQKKVIVVIQSGSAMILGDWREEVDAIIQMWLAGEGAGAAIAEILTGKSNPRGKLPETFPKVMRTDLEYPGDGRKVVYKERYEVGYRYYDSHPEEIAFPFGHGLSYTDFRYDHLAVTCEERKITITFEVENTGDVDGAEVAQIYVGVPASAVSRPVKELKAFEKIWLKAGEIKSAAIGIPVEELAYYNSPLRQWVVETGEYEILVGSSSRDIRLSQKIYIDGKMPYTQEQKGQSMIG